MRERRRPIELYYPSGAFETASRTRRLIASTCDLALPWCALVLLYPFLPFLDDWAGGAVRAAALEGADAFALLDVRWLASAYQLGAAAAGLALLGQTPGKRLAGLCTVRLDGARASGRHLLLREMAIKGLVFGALTAVSLGAAYAAYAAATLRCAWDRDRRSLWDRLARTHVVYSPLEARPLSLREFRALGQQPPGRRTAAH